MDLSRNIILEIDLNTGHISTTTNNYFYNTDRNIAYFYIKLYRTNIVGEKQYISEADSSQYKVYITTIKPKTISPVKLLGERVTNSDIDDNVIYKITIPNELMKQQGFVYCEGQVIYNKQELTTDCFSFKVNPDKLTEYNLTLITDPDLPILQNLINQIKHDVRGIDDNKISGSTVWSSEHTNLKFVGIDSQIGEIANKKTSLNDCTPEMLAAIQNKQGETTFNLLSIPQDKSIDYTKFKSDLHTATADWSKLTMNSDNTGNWCNNFLYKRGFVKNIKIGVNSATDVTGTAYIYQLFENGTIKVQSSYEFIGHGEVVVPVNKYIEYSFYVSTKCQNVRYDASTTVTSGSLGTRADNFTPILTEFKYVFAVGVEFDNLYDTADKLTFNIQRNLLRPCALMPSEQATDYPIIFDFISKQLTISNMFIVDTSNSSLNATNYYLANQTLEIKDIPAEDYYVIYLLFNVKTKALSLAYSNGESLRLNLETFTDNLLVCYGLTNGKSYFTFGDSNKDYVKVLMKESINTDITDSDDRIIPKYAEKKIITAAQQKNRWYNKKANILGDSIIKGENSDDGYKRMKDDNVASILMENFGFRVVRNYGIGGSRITTHANQYFAKMGMVDRYTDLDNDADLNIVSGGTNDFSGVVQLGDLSDLSDNTKFKPALYNLLKGMQDKYPGKELYFIVPAHRNDNLPDNVKNGAGLTLKDYVNACYEVCELLSVPVIDMWKELGISPHNPTMKSKYMKDGLHPSIEGMRKYYGKKICKSIK